jgi:hypothetical protein
MSTRAGLESLRLESEDAARVLSRRAYASGRHRAVCWWAELPDAAVADALCHIAAGDRRLALVAIEHAPGGRLGPILPDD